MYQRIAVLTKKEWKDYIKHNPIPKEYYKTKNHQGRVIYTIYNWNS